MEIFLSKERSGILASYQQNSLINREDIAKYREILYRYSRYFPNKHIYYISIEIFEKVIRSYLVEYMDKLFHDFIFTCVNLAYKITDPNIDVEDVKWILRKEKELSKDKKLVLIEELILKELDYNLYFPTPYYFLKTYLDLFDFNENYLKTIEKRQSFSLKFSPKTIEEEYIYHLNNIIRDVYTKYLPSIIALSILYIIFNDKDYDITELLKISDYAENEILHVIHFIYPDIYEYIDVNEDNIIRNYYEKVKLSDEEYEKLDKYYRMAFKIEKIGEGSYSKVYKVRVNFRKAKILALKKFSCDKNDICRSDLTEITILKNCKSSNIVSLQYVFSKKSEKFNYYSIFLEYIDQSLDQFIKNTDINQTRETRKRISLQLLNSIKYLHSLSILHRDIKSANILINRNGDIKLADFGISLLYNLNEEKSIYVYTQNFQSVELLIGNILDDNAGFSDNKEFLLQKLKEIKNYSYEADVWACGVTIFELMSDKLNYFYSEIPKRNLERFIIKSPDWEEVVRIYNETGKFPEQETSESSEEYIDDEIYLINKIFSFIGEKQEDEIMEKYQKYSLIIEGLNEIRENNGFSYLNDLDFIELLKDDLLIDLIKNMIIIEKYRFTVDECILHPWFMS